MEKKDQLNFYADLNEISFYFFFSIGLIHIISGLLTANDLLIKISWLVNKLLDVPFFIVFTLYCFSALKLHNIKQNKNTGHADMWLAVLGGAITLGLFIFDLTFSNRLPI